MLTPTEVMLSLIVLLRYVVINKRMLSSSIGGGGGGRGRGRGRGEGRGEGEGEGVRVCMLFMNR